MSTPASLSPAPSTRRKALPVTAHPWFPVIAALWFAALLGLSSLVVAPAVLERLVAASGIANFVAAAAPPLGQTARLLTALGLAGLGGLAGLVLGRLVAANSRRAGRGKAVVCAPDDAEQPAMSLRYRLAKLTGQGDGPRDFDDLPKLRGRDRHPDAPSRKPLVPSEDLAAEPLEPQADWTAEVETDPAYVPPQFEAEPEVAGEPEPEVLGAAQPEVAGEEPLQLSVEAADQAPLLHCAPASPPIPIERAPLDSLGVVQLTERLAISMQERRQRNARRAVQAPLDGAPEAAPLEITHSLSVAARPSEVALPYNAGLNRDALETGYSSLRGFSRKPATPFASAVAGDKADRAAASPGGRPADPAETYRALKSALDSLQRISGTG